MTHIIARREDKTHKVPVATVADMLSLMDGMLQDARVKLMRDLDDAKASSEDRAKALAQLRAEYGLTAKLMQSAFSLEGAVFIIRHQTPEEDWASILNAPADDLVYIALKILGYEEKDRSEQESDTERADAEGKAVQAGKTSTEA